MSLSRLPRKHVVPRKSWPRGPGRRSPDPLPVLSGSLASSAPDGHSFQVKSLKKNRIYLVGVLRFFCLFVCLFVLKILSIYS